MLEHRLEHRVDGVEDRAALALDEHQRAQRVPGLHQHQAAPWLQVESGTLRPPHVPGAGSACSTRSSRRQAELRAAVPAVRHAVAVRDHRALRERRRARRIEQREDVVGRGRGTSSATASPAAEHVGRGGGSRGRGRRRPRGRGAGGERRRSSSSPGIACRQLGEHLVQRLEVVHGPEVVGHAAGPSRPTASGCRRARARGSAGSGRPRRRPAARRRTARRTTAGGWAARWPARRRGRGRARRGRRRTRPRGRCSSAKVIRSSPKTMASRAPCCAATAASSSGAVASANGLPATVTPGGTGARRSCGRRARPTPGSARRGAPRPDHEPVEHRRLEQARAPTRRCPSGTGRGCFSISAFQAGSSGPFSVASAGVRWKCIPERSITRFAWRASRSSSTAGVAEPAWASTTSPSGTALERLLQRLRGCRSSSSSWMTTGVLWRGGDLQQLHEGGVGRVALDLAAHLAHVDLADGARA